MQKVKILTIFIIVFIVRGQVAAPDLTLTKILGQIAEFTFQHRATVTNIAWCHGGIIVWSQVQVDRYRQFNSTIIGKAKTRGQNTGSTTVINREVKIWHCQHRHIFYIQFGATGFTATGFLI